jgi:hypothetical protein
MHTYQKHTAAPALARPAHEARVIRLSSYRRRKSRSSADIWNVIFSVLAVALAACVFIR